MGSRPKSPGAVTSIEAIVGKTLRRCDNPLLVSVRSGARASMPGMMDTVLNLGLNDETVEGLASKAGDMRFAWIPIAASSRCIPTWCSMWRRPQFRGDPRILQGRARLRLDTD
jgi:hypothetical protein